jgi:hypothetical protein
MSAIDGEAIKEATAGIADAEAGRYVTIATSEDAQALHQRTIVRLRDRLAADKR